MKPVVLKSIAVATWLVCASSASLAASVSGTGFQATYDDSLNRFGTVDLTTPNSFTWLFSGEALTQTFSVTGGNKSLITLPQVTFAALDGYTINSITFFVQGTGRGIMYSTDGFDTAQETTHTGGGSFDYLVSGFAPTPISAGSPYQLTGMSFWVQSLGNTATATSGTFAVSVSAVPEPAAYGLMLSGLAALGVVARRRKQG